MKDRYFLLALLFCCLTQIKKEKEKRIYVYIDDELSFLFWYTVANKVKNKDCIIREGYYIKMH